VSGCEPHGRHAKAWAVPKPAAGAVRRASWLLAWAAELSGRKYCCGRRQARAGRCPGVLGKVALRSSSPARQACSGALLGVGLARGVHGPGVGVGPRAQALDHLAEAPWPRQRNVIVRYWSYPHRRHSRFRFTHACQSPRWSCRRRGHSLQPSLSPCREVRLDGPRDAPGIRSASRVTAWVYSKYD
jgi:hypothetical protein